MPNPYVDSLKIAKELENKAKEFQKKKKEIEEGIERLKLWVELLKKFGIYEDIDEKINKMLSLIKEHNVDDALKLYNETQYMLSKDWEKFVSNEYSKQIENIRKMLGENYSEYFSEISGTDIKEFSADSIKKVIDKLEKLDNSIREKINMENIGDYKDIFETISKDVESLIKKREDINSKLKEILSSISQMELYAYKNRIDILKIEDQKKEAISLFRNDVFNDTLSILEKYQESLYKEIIKNVDWKIKKIEELVERANKLEINIDEFKKPIDEIKTSENIYDINKISESLKRIEQMLERKIFDGIVAKFSNLNNDLKDIYGDSIPDDINEKVKVIRESIKQSNLEYAFQVIKETMKESENLKSIQSNLRNKLEELKNKLNVIPLSESENESLKNEINAITQSKIIEKSKVEIIESKVEEYIKNHIVKFESQIDEANLLFYRYNKKEFVIDRIKSSEMNVDRLQNLIELSQKATENLKKMGKEIELKLEKKGNSVKCSEGNDVDALIKSINECYLRYQELILIDYSKLRNLLIDYNSFLKSIDLNIPKIEKFIEIIERKPDKETETIIFEAEKIITEIRKIIETILENYYSISDEIKKIDNLSDADIIKEGIKAVESLNGLIKKRMDYLDDKTGEIFLMTLGINEVNIDSKDNKLISSQVEIIKVKIKSIKESLLHLQWFNDITRENNIDINNIKSYEELVEVILKSLKYLFAKHPEYALNPGYIRKIVCIENFAEDRSELAESKEFEEIAKDRIVKDLSVFYNVNNVISNEALDDALREKTKEILMGLRSRKVSTPVNISIRRIESLMNDKPREAYLAALEIYDENVEPGYMRKEINGMITRLRSIINDYSQEVPWFQEEFKKVAGLMVIGNYTGAISSLNDIINRASKDLPYIRYLKNGLNELNKESEILSEDDRKNLLNIKRMIMEYKFREAYDAIKNIKERIKQKSLTSEVDRNREIIELVASLLITNLFNKKYCEFLSDNADAKSMLSNYSSIYVVKALEELKDVMSAIETEVNLDKITLKNQLELGIFIFNLRTSLILKLADKIKGKIVEITENSEKIIITKLFLKYWNILNNNYDGNSLDRFYLDINNSLNLIKKDIEEWSKDLVGTSVDDAESYNNLNTIIAKTVKKYLESNVEIPMVYNPEEIKKRVDFLESKGFKINKDADLNDIIVEIQKSEEKLKTDFTAEIETNKVEKRKGFVLECKLNNVGQTPIYDLTLSFRKIKLDIGDLNPGERREIKIKQDNSSPETLLLSGITFDLKQLFKKWEVPPIEKYLKYMERGREGCVYCKGAIITGIEALKCNICGATYHFKCAQRSKKCIVCGNDFGL